LRYLYRIETKKKIKKEKKKKRRKEKMTRLLNQEQNRQQNVMATWYCVYDENYYKVPSIPGSFFF
jgi:hypothetical protein